ncbi:hypothetical protein GCM10023149_26570 [Mucilaginibacter gynuensis]|uniref:peptidylprolyl isomerase n=1 Tax=Mucilaginibacter gynuensis TaxID=1302236 RepID=A0ABP8GIR3_9SPHI
MKQKLFTFLLLSTVILAASCKRDSNYPDIRAYDNEQIKNYIAANNLTDFKRDTTNGDTSGMYYKIIQPGTGDADLKYSDTVSLVFTIKTFDGKYTSADTVVGNHVTTFVGYITKNGLPKGLEVGIYNILKRQGGSMRLLIPSRMAYGVNGIGSGSSSVVNGRIAGNQCLDYYVHVVDNLKDYDDRAIQRYMSDNGLAGYTKATSGLYYKISGLDTGKIITQTSSVTATYTRTLFNGTIFDQATASATVSIDGELLGVQQGLKLAKNGQSISLLMPSRLAFGRSSALIGSLSIPAFSCIRNEFSISGVTYY